MSGFSFQEPGSMEYINPEQCAGQLLIIWPVQHVNPAPPTKFSRPDKVDDAISVDVVTLDQLDDSGVPKVFRAQLWRQSRLIQSFRQRIGQGPLLGTIGKGTATMGNPPWIFISLTHDATAVQRANAWGAANEGFKASEPREYTVEAPRPQQPQQSQSQQQGGYWQGGPPNVGNGYQQPQYSQYQQQLPAHHEQGPPPQWSEPAPQQYPVPPVQQPQYPPLPPPQQQQQQGPPQPANPAQQSILQRLAQQHQQQPDPNLQGEQAQQQYGF